MPTSLSSSSFMHRQLRMSVRQSIGLMCMSKQPDTQAGRHASRQASSRNGNRSAIDVSKLRRTSVEVAPALPDGLME